MITARWIDCDGASLEHLKLSETGSGIHIESVIIARREGESFALSYRISCRPDWSVVSVDARIIGSELSVSLRSDGAGNWTTGTRTPLSALAGAIDADLSATPFTNSLPIRRLGLARGEAAVIRAAYVSVPDLTVSLDEQRYTRIGDLSWRYEAVDGSFAREIEVDAFGLVTHYPGLFRRIG
ncbi:hypothetical protein FHS85_000597 [Rhodoligotrophos appendicifer]|uniref:putative glycolipid-binding domain-containing protein n=1 Tax=Rhodoligotrophos appendicifer TaxID=987056 RepID=UPI00117FF761|nr:putative glycolipid-binding domain-containing protein [Rhodoligotrophos appendicifer]